MKYFKIKKLSYVISLAVLGASNSLSAQDDDSVELETYTAEDTVEDKIGILPTEPVESVFGFGKTLLETPRSATSITTEVIDRFGIADIDDLVVLSPGAFTQSFFGVAGSLDVRGTPGETYFRGVRRLDNPGNYPTPIGASDRIDIVRGPASPIYGPSKIGGYLNFVPKSARAETGQFLEEPTGEMSFEVGSWDKNILTAEVGGPGDLFGKKLGYYAYVEIENSDSYYENTQTDQTVFQLSFNLDLTDSIRFEFGGMYHDYDGNQVAGWNRLTQDLIDNGTYITGTAQPADLDGDGLISHQEYGRFAGGAGADTFIFGPGLENGLSSVTNDDIPAEYALINPGTTKLDGSQVLVSPDDVLQNEVTTLYYDFIYDGGEGFSITNKLFYEEYENLNENAYGFSQFHDSFVIENQLIFELAFESKVLTTNLQLSPSYRLTDFEHGDDYSNELFDRRDLTMPSSALDARLLATQIDDDYTEFYEGEYTDFGLAVLADLQFSFGLDLLLGVRQDFVDVESNTPAGVLLCPELVDLDGDGELEFLSLSANEFSGPDCSDEARFAEDSTDGTSWTVSASYNTPIGLVPYITFSEQFTLVAGQGAEITISSIDPGDGGDPTYFDTSELTEIGIKGSLLDDTLYFTLAGYEQTRTDANAQAIVTNQTAETEGIEFELRYVITDSISIAGAYTQIEVLNLNTDEMGSRFSFIGAEDVPNVDPTLLYGGQLVGVVPNAENDGALKAGIPEESYSLSATYDFLNGITTYLSYFHADETPSGHSRSVILPSYDLFNAGINYSNDDWTFSFKVNNLTDERYFRSNFPDLFGSQIVLQEKPRHYSLVAAYKF